MNGPNKQTKHMKSISVTLIWTRPLPLEIVSGLQLPLQSQTPDGRRV